MIDIVTWEFQHETLNDTTLINQKTRYQYEWSQYVLTVKIYFKQNKLLVATTMMTSCKERQMGRQQEVQCHNHTKIYSLNICNDG